jgi:hypothetical protein
MSRELLSTTSLSNQSEFLKRVIALREDARKQASRGEYAVAISLLRRSFEQNLFSERTDSKRALRAIWDSILIHLNESFNKFTATQYDEFQRAQIVCVKKGQGSYLVADIANEMLLDQEALFSRAYEFGKCSAMVDVLCDPTGRAITDSELELLQELCE